MDWDDVRVFLAVARSESLSGAGRILKCDPATVGRRIARLEGQLGVELFQKTPHGYRMTEPAARLLAHAEAMEQASNAATEDVLGGLGQLRGQFRIGAPDGCANYLLPQICKEISEAHPALELQIVALPRVFNLSRREADLAIAVSRPQTGRLLVQKLSDYRLHLAGHADYLAAHPPLRRKEDLKHHRMVGYISDMIFDRELDYLAETGVEGLRLSSNSVSVQMQMLRAGAGLAIVHDFAIPSVPGLRRVLTEAISLKRSFWLLRHADDRRSARLDQLSRALAVGLEREVTRLEALAADA